jgi:hypothetical protein
MQLNVCKHCHRIFYSHLKLQTCEECKKLDDELFEKIEDYLMKYPNSNAIQIADGLKIQAHEVLSFIDEGRLIIAKGYFEKN